MEQSIGSGVGGGYRSGRSGGGGGRRGGGGGRREDGGERREDGGGRREDGGERRGGGGGRREGGGERREDGGERREGGGRRRQYSGGSASGNVVKARGLPFKVALTEVVDFFSEYDVSVLQKGGESYCEPGLLCQLCVRYNFNTPLT